VVLFLTFVDQSARQLENDISQMLSMACFIPKIFAVKSPKQNTTFAEADKTKALFLSSLWTEVRVILAQFRGPFVVSSAIP